jgi:hypothetical protein
MAASAMLIERMTATTETTMRMAQTEEALLTFDVSDLTLEKAACGGLQAGAATLSFYTGLDSCPAPAV